AHPHRRRGAGRHHADRGREGHGGRDSGREARGRARRGAPHHAGAARRGERRHGGVGALHQAVSDCAASPTAIISASGARKNAAVPHWTGPRRAAISRTSPTVAAPPTRTLSAATTPTMAGLARQLSTPWKSSEKTSV